MEKEDGFGQPGRGVHVALAVVGREQRTSGRGGVGEQGDRTVHGGHAAARSVQQSGRSFDYSQSVRIPASASVPEQQITAFTQPPPPLALGSDLRSLFTPSSAALLERAASAREVTVLNPLWIHPRSSGRPFYAIVHRIDVGIVIDLEPARSEDPALSIAGAV